MPLHAQLVVVAYLLSAWPRGATSGGADPPRHKPFSPDPSANVTRVSRDVVSAAVINYPPNHKCSRFAEGPPGRGEFFSPMYPSNYPNQTVCIRVLEADPGHLLRLDFRSEFHIEPSENCRYDALEVRDGAHGYEEQIGKFCGNKFPDMIHSSGRYLWLRFRSDENIEYKGFNAVYESIPKPNSSYGIPEQEPCRIEVGGSEGILSKQDINQSIIKEAVQHNIPVECMWVITVEEGWKIQMTFDKFNLVYPNDCNANFVEVFGLRTDMDSRLAHFCGSIGDSVTSNSSVVHVRYKAEAKAINSSFESLYTAFRPAEKKPCRENEYDCQDDRCISADLQCNHRNNCRYRWDESECTKKVGSFESIMNKDHIIIILVVFAFIMTGMCGAFLFNCFRKLIHDHRAIQDHIRRSREGHLDSMGRDGSPCASVVRCSAELEVLQTTPTAGSRTTPTAIDCYVPPARAGDLVPILVPGSQPTHAIGHHPPLPQPPTVSYEEESEQGDDGLADMSSCPEMRDNECQTRDSLFLQSELSTTPSPPPPLGPPGDLHFSTFGYGDPNLYKDYHRRNPSSCEHSNATTVSSIHHTRSGASQPPGPRSQRSVTVSETSKGGSPAARDRSGGVYRAEALIEMGSENNTPNSGTTNSEAVADQARGFSVASSKSAPDVIVSH